eukprot:scaffold5169_cov366-Prasinococcus_capsulatus_cf.AAC.9
MPKGCSREAAPALLMPAVDVLSTCVHLSRGAFRSTGGDAGQAPVAARSSAALVGRNSSSNPSKRRGLPSCRPRVTSSRCADRRSATFPRVLFRAEAANEAQPGATPGCDARPERANKRTHARTHARLRRGRGAAVTAGGRRLGELWALLHAASFNRCGGGGERRRGLGRNTHTEASKQASKRTSGREGRGGAGARFSPPPLRRARVLPRR